MVIGEASAIGGTLSAVAGVWLSNVTLAILVLALPSLRFRSGQTSRA
jgi:hypothetical protein